MEKSFSLETNMTTYTTIHDFPKYQISNMGDVRRVKKDGSYRIINPWKNQRHLMVTLTDKWEKKVYYVHRLVQVHFGPEQPEDLPLVLHRDDDPTNNRLDNLVWGNKVMNAQMAVKNGRLRPHAEHVFLTKAQADEALDLYESGWSMKAVAQHFGCSRWTISNIVHGRTAKFL